MENGITKTENAGLPAHRKYDMPEILASDILVPYALLMQAPSDLVKERKAQMGDIVRNNTAEILGGPDKPLDVIFLHYPEANWILEQKSGQRFEYRQKIARNGSNETLGFYFWGDKDGNEVSPGSPGATEWRRVKQFQVYGIIAGDIEAETKEREKRKAGGFPDPSKALRPCRFTFRSTSYKAGKEVCTFYTDCLSVDAPIHAYSLTVGCTLQKNDDGSWYAWKIDRAKPKNLTADQFNIADTWVSRVRQGGVRADETAEQEESAASTATRATVQGNASDVC